MKHIALGLALSILLPCLAQSQPKLPLDINNRVRIEYDDNVTLSPDDEQDSIKFIESLELLKNFDMERSLLSLRYNPSFTYWEDRADDDTDVHHELDVRLRHRVNETTGFSLTETLRFAEHPELIESGTVIRENNDFLYNSIGLGADTRFSGKFIADAEAKFNTLAYDEDDVADRNDYDQGVFGASVRYEVAPETEAGGQLRFTSYDYEDDGRDADSFQVGVVGNRNLNSAVSVSARAGLENKDFDGANTGSIDEPYVGASINIAPAAHTVLDLGFNYSPAEAPIATFANQNRTAFYARLSRELTNKVTWNLAGIFSSSEYDSAESSGSVDPNSVADGDEEVVRVSSRLSYAINRLHAVEANIAYTDLNSDVRPAEEYDRTRVSIGWRVNLGGH